MSETNLTIAKPITLPCGLALPNRLAKAAMAEGWGDKDKLPHANLIRTYQLWADGNWGMILTGNVHVDAAYLATPDDNAVSDGISRHRLVSAWAAWAAAANERGTPAIMQINHPGRQSTLGSGTRSYLAKTIGPSAVPVNLGSGIIARASSALVFGTPRAMSEEDIDNVVERFATAATLAHEAGFAGVQVHCGHGYLLAQFLSSKTNMRTDEYGGAARHRAKIVVRVIKAIKAVVPKTFCIGVKINSVDHQASSELQSFLEQLDEMIKVGIDFLEISGGTYESPDMLVSTTATTAAKVTPSTAAREAFFLEFAKAIRKEFPHTCLMVTGGFRSRLGLEHAVASGACDLAGIGRPSVLQPKLPKEIIFNSSIADEDTRLQTTAFSYSWLGYLLGIKGLSGGTETVTSL
ncbi:hypothetical protein NHJ13734_009305 [Beauveria thailandica]